MQVYCSRCRTPLLPPPGGGWIGCYVCGAVTLCPTVTSPPLPSQHYGYPSPHVLPGGPPASPHGKKKAVICGITYRHTSSPLTGTVNDAKRMKYLLVNSFRFPAASILMLTEEETDPYRIPTKHNIVRALCWLVQGCQPGDSLVFHYSGHGSQRRNYNIGDEVDGYDETLCPLDYETQGDIVDDEINAAIVRPLPRGVKLHAFIDACHSGTVLDLPFLCRMNRSGQYAWEDHRPLSGAWKGTSGGEAICFSGCDDNEISMAVPGMMTPSGALPYCFIQAIERGQGATYGSILNSMRSTIQCTEKFVGRPRQDPQLTACTTFNVYTKPFVL